MSKKDNLQDADGKKSKIDDNKLINNNPDSIVEELKNEPDNLVEDTQEEKISDQVASEPETTDATSSPTNNSNGTSDTATIKEDPKQIVEKLKDDSDNLIESEQTSKLSEVAAKHSSNSKVSEETNKKEDKPTTAENDGAVISKTTTDNKETSKIDGIITEAGKESTNDSVEESEDDRKAKDDSHVTEIEESNAEDAEDSGNEERHDLEAKDYEKMTMTALNDEFEYLLKNKKVQTIKSHVDDIRSEFNSKFDDLLEEKKEKYISEGGDELSFYYTTDQKKRFNSLYKSYKDNLRSYYKELETTLKSNLEKRLEIIEEIKGLINVEENINTTYKQFKELQEQWRHAGNIPRDRYNNTWNTYHHHVEIFYDFLHLNRDLRDLDFKHNLEQKLKIIERAEELVKEENINRAFRELQVLHKMWKEDYGPVAKEHRNDIWERFSTATKKIHDKRQAYYADLDKAYEANLERKNDIIKAIDDVIDKEPKSHQDWQKKIKEVEALRQSFFNAGKVPKKVNEKTWARFKSAVRKFNKVKNQFYKDLKKDQYDNLKKKLDLIAIAEEHKESEDYETSTPIMKRIQSEWKDIGHVPRKESDKIWKRFKKACNYYFDKLNAKRKEDNKELYEAFDKKTKLLEEVKGFKLSSKGPEANKKHIQAYIDKWNSYGEVPYNKRYIEGKFNKSVNELYDQLKLEKTDIEMIKYENKLENLSKPEGTDLLDNEHNFIRKKIDELKSEINQLENNMQFFSNADESNPLVKEVINNINNHKANLQLWEEKLLKVKKMY